MQKCFKRERERETHNNENLRLQKRLQITIKVSRETNTSLCCCCCIFTCAELEEKTENVSIQITYIHKRVHIRKKRMERCELRLMLLVLKQCIVFARVLKCIDGASVFTSNFHHSHRCGCSSWHHTYFLLHYLCRRSSLILSLSLFQQKGMYVVLIKNCCLNIVIISLLLFLLHRFRLI